MKADRRWWNDGRLDADRRLAKANHRALWECMVILEITHAVAIGCGVPEVMLFPPQDFDLIDDVPSREITWRARYK